jgi:hypothetical protein
MDKALGFGGESRHPGWAARRATVLLVVASAARGGGSSNDDTLPIRCRPTGMAQAGASSRWQ